MAADSSTDQPRFHKWMHEMTITENATSNFTPMSNTWGPTAKVVSVQDKKGRKGFVPIEWLEKEPKPKVWKVGQVIRGNGTGRVWLKVTDDEWRLLGEHTGSYRNDKRLPDTSFQPGDTAAWEEIN